MADDGSYRRIIITGTARFLLCSSRAIFFTTSRLDMRSRTKLPREKPPQTVPQSVRIFFVFKEKQLTEITASREMQFAYRSNLLTPSN